MDELHPDTMARVADACADDAEALSLSIIRMIAAGYSTGDVACWDMAHAGAERSLGPEAAARLVGSLTTLVRALRAERSTEFYVMPATCCRVTSDEAGIVRLMNVARRRDGDGVARVSAAVTEGRASPRTRTAATIVGRVLDDVAVEMIATTPDRPCARPRMH